MDNHFIVYEKELRALANRRRLKILFYLKRHKTAYVLEIADELKISFKTASKHPVDFLMSGFSHEIK